MLQRIRLGFCWEAIILVLVLPAGPALAVVPTDAEDQTSAQAADPVAGGQRVFSAGHSLHVFVPGILNDMAKAAGIQNHVPVDLSAIGGSRVIQHPLSGVKKEARPSATNVSREARQLTSDQITISLHRDVIRILR